MSGASEGEQALMDQVGRIAIEGGSISKTAISAPVNIGGFSKDLRKD